MSPQTSGEKGISAFPANDNILQWLGTIEGAEETPYAGLRFKLSLKFGSDYPFRPPAVRFETPCFHPNVSQAGDICLDILRVRGHGSAPLAPGMEARGFCDALS